VWKQKNKYDRCRQLRKQEGGPPGSGRGGGWCWRWWKWRGGIPAWSRWAWCSSPPCQICFSCCM